MVAGEGQDGGEDEETWNELKDGPFAVDEDNATLPREEDIAQDDEGEAFVCPRALPDPRAPSPSRIARWLAPTVGLPWCTAPARERSTFLALGSDRWANIDGSSRPHGRDPLRLAGRTHVRLYADTERGALHATKGRLL